MPGPTHRSTWKARERQAAALFGSKRQRCSGSSGREDCSRSDSTHDRLYIETKLKALDDVKSMKTTIEDGLGVTQIEFIAGSDADKKNDDVLREINALRPSLPTELRSLEVKRFNAANVNILQVALVSESAPYAQLEAVS